VRAVREDPKKRGLLYAATETGLYVSFNDGANWQSLQLNLPITSVRDLNVHGSDLVAATYGRGLWILDDVSPLRQIDETRATALLKPAEAVRVRFDNDPDTPLSVDLAHSENPPEGAIIYYYLKSAAKNVSLEIYDGKNNLVRSFSSTAPPADTRQANVPDYWFAPPDVLTTHAGLNRFAWNLEWPHPDALTYNFRGRHIDYIEYTLPDHAVPGRTPRYQPPGPLALPGNYVLVLTVDGKKFRQALTVNLDPRVQVNPGDLEAQLDAARMIDEWMNTSYSLYNSISQIRPLIAESKKKTSDKALLAWLENSEKELSELQEGTSEAPGFGAINRDVTRFVSMIQSADRRPAKSIIENATPSCIALKNNLARLRKALRPMGGNSAPGISFPESHWPNDPRCPAP
jgi:hypothetical protein